MECGRLWRMGHNSLMANARSALGEARLKKEQALARLRQLQTGQLEGSLLDREQVREQWAQAFAALRDRALALGDRITSRGAGRGVEELRKIVDSEVRDMLLTISRGEF
jgi:hypothetical protein